MILNLFNNLDLKKSMKLLPKNLIFKQICIYQCANIVQTILNLSNKTKQAYLDKSSEAFQIQTIYEKLPENIKLTSDEISHCLQKLKKEK